MATKNTKTTLATLVMGTLAVSNVQAALIDEIRNKDAQTVASEKETLKDQIATELSTTKTNNDKSIKAVESYQIGLTNVLLDKGFTKKEAGQFTNAVQGLKDFAQSNADKIADLNAELATTIIENKVNQANIETAQKTADDAATAAKSADDKAATAQTTADTAVASAKAADDKAVAAQTTADTAVASAKAADDKAVAAQTTADTALSKTQELENTKADKADLSKLDSRVTTVESTVTQHTTEIANLNTQVINNSKQINQLNNRMTELEKQTEKGLAAQAALTGLFQPYRVGKFNVSAAMGGYKSTTALAVGGGYRFNENFAVKAGVATSTRGGGAAYNVGVNFEW